MDAAPEAFVRYLALQAWREIQEIWSRETSPEERWQALQALGGFEDRGEYAPIWQRHWADLLTGLRGSADPTDCFQLLEATVARSLEEEEAARRQEGRPGVLEEGDGRRFLDLALGRLLEEAQGEIWPP